VTDAAYDAAHAQQAHARSMRDREFAAVVAEREKRRRRAKRPDR
jgi:hypothetical protein